MARRALWAWLGIVVMTVVWFGSGLFVGDGKIDADIPAGLAGLPDVAIMAVWISAPAGLLAFVALPPLGFALDRTFGPIRTVWARVIVGIALALPLFLAFVVATKVPQQLGLLGPKRSTLAQDFAAIAHRPQQALPFLMLFAVGGTIFMLRNPTNLTNPTN